MAKGRKPAHSRPKPSVAIPKTSPYNQPSNVNRTSSDAGSSPGTPKTPKTPADEAIEYFQSSITLGETPVQVYVLPLDPDGGPNKDRSVRDNASYSANNFTICLLRAVHSASTCICSLYPSGRYRRRDTCIEEWRVQDQLSLGWGSICSG